MVCSFYYELEIYCYVIHQLSFLTYHYQLWTIIFFHDFSRTENFVVRDTALWHLDLVSALSGIARRSRPSLKMICLSPFILQDFSAIRRAWRTSFEKWIVSDRVIFILFNLTPLTIIWFIFHNLRAPQEGGRRGSHDPGGSANGCRGCCRLRRDPEGPSHLQDGVGGARERRMQAPLLQELVASHFIRAGHCVAHVFANIVRIAQLSVPLVLLLSSRYCDEGTAKWYERPLPLPYVALL